MITSRLTSKAQTTLPQPVRAALGLGEGDEIAYSIEEGTGRVVIAKATPPARGEAEDPFAVFSEWDGPADSRAYAGL
jgi:antitoxin PrlF